MDTKYEKLLRIETVIKLVTYKRSSIYQKIKEDKFPPALIKRPGFTAWSQKDIDLYIVYLQNKDLQLKWSQFIKNIKE